jgi:hypothetical protein
VRTLRGDMENLQIRVGDLEETLEGKERMLRRVEGQVRDREVVMQRAQSLRQEKEMVIEENRMNEEYLKKCY